jgi:hypothetical protein
VDRCPRASGDGPLPGDVSMTHVGVVPARAGMDRGSMRRCAACSCCPRASGDGPGGHWVFGADQTLSPRERGWTDVHHAHHGLVDRCPRASGDGPLPGDVSMTHVGVVPARAGMDRCRVLALCSVPPLSPRERGWTASVCFDENRSAVVPARAGMNRGRGSARDQSGRCPRASGDGPIAPPAASRGRLATRARHPRGLGLDRGEPTHT